jgi:hypothetical protein
VCGMLVRGVRRLVQMFVVLGCFRLVVVGIVMV